MITGFDNNMSDTLTTSTSRGGSRRMVSPVTFKKDRDTADVQINRSSLENGHGFSDTFTNSTGSSISMPRIDSCILGKETLEQREKFTVSKTGRSLDISLLRSAFRLMSATCLFTALQDRSKQWSKKLDNLQTLWRLCSFE